MYRGFAFRKSGEKVRIINENIDNKGKKNALWAHNPKVGCSNHSPATRYINRGVSKFKPKIMKKYFSIQLLLYLMFHSCTNRIDEAEIRNVELAASKMQEVFICSEIKANVAFSLSPEDGTSKCLVIHLTICDSLDTKEKIDSLKDLKILELSKNAFNKISDKKTYKYFSTKVANDYEELLRVKAYNFAYDSLKKDFIFLNNEWVPQGL